MTIIAHRRRETRPHVSPLRTELLSERITRCGVCQRLWPERDMREEDGIQKCPNDVDVTTETYKAAILEIEAEKAERYVITPNIAQVPMEITIPATVSNVACDGVSVYQGAPLAVLRGGLQYVIVLTGRGFDASDVIDLPNGATLQDSATTESQTILYVTFDTTPVGPASITYASNVLKNILEVR